MSIEFLSQVYSRINQLVGETVNTLRNYEEYDAAKELDIIFRDRLIDNRFNITVYGIYNAGKSTFINALLGEEKAAVGDVPTTDRLTKYEWNDVLIQDTPGIDAPEEHEQISNEEIKNSDIVLFLVGSGDGSYEERKVWEQLQFIIDNEKPLIVLINDLKRYMFSSNGMNELNRIQGKFITRSLDEIGFELKPLIVNAKAAWNIKQGRSKYILEDTGLPQIEAYITQLVMSRPKVQRFDTPIKKANELLKNILNRRIVNLSDLDKEYFRKELEIETSLDQFLTRLDQLIEDEISRLFDLLYNTLYRGDDPSDLLDTSFQNILTELNLELNKPKLTVHSSLKNNSDKESEHGKDFAEKVIIKPIDDFIKDPDSRRKIQVEIYRGMKKYMEKPEHLRWKTWKEDVWKKSGNLAKGFGYFLQVGLAGWDYYQKKKEQEQRLIKEKDKMEIIVKEVNSILNHFSSTIRIEISSALRRATEENIEVLKREFENSALRSEVLEFNKLINEMNMLRHEIRSYVGRRNTGVYDERENR